VDKRVDSSHCGEGAERVTCFDERDESVDLVENQLEPELARLMDDDEKQLVGVFRAGAGALQLEKFVEGEIR